MIWFQKTIQLPRFRRGFHLITDLIVSELDVSHIQMGLLHVFVQHTSASLSVNENADPDVRVDMELAMNHVVPEDLDYVHTMEGTDDMPAHVKASLLGSSVSIPISNGRLAFGTWQGIYLCEHRDHADRRSIMITVMGQAKPS